MIETLINTDLSDKLPNTPSLKSPEVLSSGLIVRKKDSLGRIYATGRRKRSVARVWIMPGKGKITINKQDIYQYFTRNTHVSAITEPLVTTNTIGQFDVWCTTSGGGHSGQAGAIRLGIARALDSYHPQLHTQLRQNGYLMRDPREVERKKYGKRKARKGTQFSKR